MALIYRYGVRSIRESDGRSLVGGCVIPSFSPFRLFLCSSSENDVFPVIVTGIAPDGSVASETITLNGQAHSFTENYYVYVDRIELRRPNSGVVSIYLENGQLTGNIDIGNNLYRKCDYVTTSEEPLILNYGVSARANEPSQPLTAELVCYKDGARVVLHTSYIPTTGGVTIIPITYSIQGRIAVECQTSGNGVDVSSWLEVQD